MRYRIQPPLARLGAVAARVLVVMLALLPALVMTGSAGVAAQDDSSGLLDETTYESPQFGYTVSWDDTWSARQRDVTSNPGGFDVITLRDGNGTLRITGRSDDYAAADFLQDTVELITRNADTSEIIAETEGDVPTVELTADRDHVIIEAHTLSDNGAVVVVTLTARERDFAAALAAARETVLLNEEPIFAATTSAGATPAVTASATEEVTPEGEDEAATEIADPATADVTETEEATEAATTESETPTEDVTDDPATDDTLGEGIDEATYTSPTYGFTVEWDDDVWEAEDRIGEDGTNELELLAASGSLYIWAGEFYEGDPAACLQGESDYYENDDPAITDWAPAENAAGEPITGETANAAYGVFTLTYTDPEEEDAESVDLVDYIECRELVPGEAVIVILATSTPDQYNAHIDDVLRITNEIKLRGEDDATTATPVGTVAPETPELDDDPGTPEGATPEASPDASPEAPGNADTGLDGSVFTSPSFGFSLEIPAAWTVEDETIAEDEERLVITNGISTITLHATDAYTGDLEGCVDFARDLAEEDPAFAGLALDETADGSPFEGSDSRRAYANFTYTGPEGEEFAHFVECRYIAEGESVLILSQDVPYDHYSVERQARRQIEDAITIAD